MTLNLVPTEGLVTKFTHVKHESPISYKSKDMANVKVFADKQTYRHTDGPKAICPRPTDAGGGGGGGGGGAYKAKN